MPPPPDSLPPLPPGFTLDTDIPPLPPGFTLDQPGQQAQAQQPEPRTRTESVMRQLGLFGRALTGTASQLVSPLTEPVRYTMNAALPGDPIGGMEQGADQLLSRAGVAEPETNLERRVQGASRFVGSVMAGGLAAKVPGLAPRAAALASPSAPAGQQVLQASQRAGYVVPPNTSNPNALTGTLEGMSGKLKTAQLAAQRNQAVTNRLAARSLGLADDTEITPDLLSAVRAEAGKAYEAVRAAGTIVTDTQFRTAVASAIRPFTDAAADFPKLAKKELFDLAEDLSKPSFDSNSAVDAIRLLRDNADAAYRAGDASLGKAYRALSGALEGAIERNLAGRGQDASGMLEGFRAAREAIAKTYTIQGALKGSNVDAATLARQLSRGKPLSGDLRTAGEFAQHFPKAARALNESIPAYSPLDMWSSAASVGAALGSGNPAYAAPAAYSVVRPMLRNFLLSPAGQRMAVQGAQQGNALAGPVIGGVGATNALIPVPLDATN